jgi:hypothetical protein
VHIGITENLRRRLSSHLREKGEHRMVQFTSKLTHGRARTIKGKLIRDRIEAVLGNPDARRGTVRQTLAAVGLIMKTEAAIREGG